MSEKVSPTKKPTSNVTVIEVEEDLSFLLSARNANFGSSVSLLDQNSTLVRKTYSKKHPIAYNPLVSYSEGSMSVASTASTGRGKRLILKPPAKSLESSENSIKNKPVKKRLPDSAVRSNECPVHKRRKKRGPENGPSLPKVNGHQTTERQRSSRELRSDREASPDSDIEIIEIVGPSSSRASFDSCRKIPNGNASPRKKQATHVLNPSSFSSYDVPVTEVDPAPNIPSYPVLSGSSGIGSSSNFQSPTKWLSANGTLSFSALPNGNSNTNDPMAKFNDKFHLYVPEMKASQKITKGKRELKGLFKNLNEISWAHEKSFKQMLTTSSDHRHSERITKPFGGKNLRKLTEEPLKEINSNEKKQRMVKKNTAKLPLKSAKHGCLKKRLVVRTVHKQKVSLNKTGKLTKSSLKSKRTVIKNSKPKKVRINQKNVLKATKGKIIRKPSTTSNNLNSKKSAVKSEKDPSIKSSGSSDKDKSSVDKEICVKHVKKHEKSVDINSILQDTTSAQAVNKPIKSILKKPLLKVRFKDPEPRNGPKSKVVSVNKDKTSESDVASSSRSWNIYNEPLENNAGNCSYRADDTNGLFSAFENNFFRSDNFSEFTSSSVVKELQKYDNEVQIINSTNSDKALETAVKKGSKLRVSVEPIEHTNLWNADFFETFKRHVLEQAFLKTFERRDQESINTMFQELQDACFHPPNNLKPIKKKKSSEEEVLRSSVRQIGRGYGYKEIFVKKMENYLQFVLLPHACKLNSLNIEAIKELKEAFIQAKKDPTCRAVLLNSSGTYFCTGIELSLLVGSNRKQAAEEMASSIRDLVLTLSTFTKPIVAAVNGTAVGLGVALLTYCDVVLASDKATFCIPATRLGYLPEGGVTLTLPQVVGSGVATEMLLYGRRLTAEQALRHGLISEVLWPTQLMNEVVPRMDTICSQPLQVMEATKTMVRCHLWDKLKTHMEREWRLLPPLWLDAQCQHNIKRTLATGWLVD